jgi:hypothetical protein
MDVYESKPEVVGEFFHKGKGKVCPCASLIKHHAMKTCGGAEV